MNRQDMLMLYKYNQWANALILNAAANVTPEEYLAPASLPHGGLRGTLVHTLFAEWIWRRRWEGISPTKRFKPDDFPTFETLRARWAKEEKALMSFVEGLSDEKLNGIFRYKSTDGELHQRTLWHAMLHMVNHGTQHRAEAAAILTDLGHSPGDIDLLGFID